MPDHELLASTVLETLGYALFERVGSGALRLAGPGPEWLRLLWPNVASVEAPVPLEEVSPFLGNFLLDASACWAQGGDAHAKSGPWVERDTRGEEVQLEAAALTIAGRAVLLVERLGEEFESRKSVLQKARETVIAYQRLNAEVQKKEILLHCLAEDMTAALGNIITSLRLMELEHNPTKVRHLLSLASQAADEQRELISRVLHVFNEEIEAVYGGGGKSLAADLHEILCRAVESSAPAFREKGVAFNALAAAASPLRIAADPAHLELVLANLLENALEQTPAGSEVAVRIEEEADAAFFCVNDGGAEIPSEVRGLLFTKFATGPASSRAALLRLHFCRIAVENWSGEIGHTPLERGNSFWIRLPKLTASP